MRHRTAFGRPPRMRSRGRLWPPLTALLAAGFLVSAACQVEPLGAGDVRRATRVALGDARLELFLDGTSSEVVEVRRPTAASGPSGMRDEAVVTIALAPPMPFASWPLDSCDIGRPSDEVTGVVWLIDLERKSVSAVSPRWGDIDCLDL